MEKVLKWSRGSCSHNPNPQGPIPISNPALHLPFLYCILYVELSCLLHLKSIQFYFCISILGTLPTYQKTILVCKTKQQSSFLFCVCQSGDRCSLCVCDAIREMCSPNEADLVQQPLLTHRDRWRRPRGAVTFICIKYASAFSTPSVLK